MSDYLPPVVIDILGRDRDFLTTLGEAKAALAQFASDAPPKVLLGADGRPLERTVAEAEAELDALGAKVVEPTIRPKVDDSYLGLLAGARTTAGATAIAGALGLATLAGGGRGGGGGGILGALGFGTSGLPFLGGLAGIGTLGSLLGFGGERVAMTGIGLAGSFGGAMLGGGLLGLGSLGVMGVGMGTNMAGMGQAANDIKSYTQAYDQLQQAIAIYGATSQQAKDAQAQLNYTLSGFPKVAQQAIVAASMTVQQFKTLFDQFTGPAEKVGAQIIQQVVKVAEGYLPVIGSFALQNMNIIKGALQPFFAWLQDRRSGTGGMGIFIDLEQIFTKDLPTAMHALEQGFELFAKTVDAAAQYTGPFLNAIDRFLTKWNSAQFFPRWSREIGTLIGDFRTWLDFFLQIGRTIFDIFAPSVGLGTHVVSFFTGVLKDLDKWLTSSTIRTELHNMFSAHLKELIQGIGGLIKALLPIAEQFMSVFIQWSTQGAGLMTAILQPLTAFVRVVSGNAVTRTLAGWALMLGLVTSRVGPLIALIGGLTRALTGLGATSMATAEEETGGGILASVKGAAGRTGMVMQGAIGVLGMGALGGIGGSVLANASEKNKNQHQRLARDLTTAGGGILGAGLGLMQVNPLAGGIVAAVGGLTMAAGEIINHWKGISKFFADDVWHPIRRAAISFWHDIDNDVIHPITRLPSDIGHWFIVGFGAVENFFKSLPGTILGFLRRLPYDLGFLIGEALGTMVRALINGGQLVWKFWTDFVPHVLGLLANLGLSLLKLGGDALHAMWSGITGAASDVWNFFTALPGKLISFIVNLPSQFTSQGHGVIHGFWQGIMDEVKTVWYFFTNFPVILLNFFKDAGHWLYQIGKDIITGLIHGIQDAVGGVWHAISGIGSGIISGFKHALGISSPSKVFMELGQHTMAGYVIGVQSMAGHVKSAVSGIAYVPSTNGYAFRGAAGGVAPNLSVTVHTHTNANAQDIANEALWAARTQLAGLAH